MAKTNFTKVEEALAEGMRKIEVDRLLTIADEKGEKVQKAPQSQPQPKVSSLHLKRLLKIEADLKSLEKQGKDPYTKLKINKEEIKKFIADPSTLTSQDWEKVAKIKEALAANKSANDDLVKQQIKKHGTKRFNVNEKWIPLH